MQQWNNKPINKQTLLLWDLENISFSYFQRIKELVKFTPEKTYLFSKQNYSEKNRKIFNDNNMQLFNIYHEDADTKLLNVLKLHECYQSVILVSSDSDFVGAIKKYLKNHKVQWIMDDNNKKRICMKIKLDDKNLSLNVL